MPTVIASLGGLDIYSWVFYVNLPMGMFGAVTFLPLFVQGVIGGSATNAGVVLTPMSLGWVTGSTGGGRLVNRLGYRQLGVLGMGLMTAGFLESNLRVTANPGHVVQGAPVTMVRSIDPRILLTPIGRSTLAPEALALMREGLARSLRLVFEGINIFGGR
ncbi:MAG: hypothetical protein HY998_05265 [candidate division NC10 bacterium]|nr:hypothetical protein [candidate division NC10 bacterium]